MSKIVKLSEQLSNMIAAGEVVEKPMGVVKELVENSLDAGATMINVNIEEGGIQSIEVIDNGCGMDQQDAVNAFGRHATSKIKDVDDLWSIGTLGFRGEAVPSIASVSKFEMITSDGKENTRVLVEYGKMVEARPYPAQQGTRIKVEGLFIKTPARLKHLKSVSNETNAVVDVMEKFAMSYPSVSFTLNCDGVERIYTTGSGQLEEILYKIYGKEAATQAVPVDFQNYDFHVTGSIVLPHVTRATKYYMTIFINGRMVRNYSIYRAIQEGY
ncbi:MAG: ATP-binding protein, partial [Erysipelotrichaceae bacterium]|nr:ATP-binding protein [Erysipelotrichaceae bacterium]